LNHVKKIYFCTNKELLDEDILAIFEQRLDCQAVFFSTGKAAFEALKKEKPLLLVIDQDLDDTPGDEFIFSLQNEHELKDVSKLILLNEDKSEIIERCLLAGCDDYVIKPPDCQIISNKLARLLNIPYREEMRIVFRCWLKGQILSQFFFGSSLDISVSGMLFSSDVALNVNDILEITFFLPASTTKMTISCKIVRMEQLSNSEDFRYGVQFLHMEESDQRFLNDYLEKLKKRQL